MEMVPLHCRSCGHFGTSECPGKSSQADRCDFYHSWSEQWAQEMCMIERTLRNTYIAAAFFAVLAAATIMFPAALT